MSDQNKLTILQKFPLFEILNEAEIERLGAMVQQKTLKKYEYVYQAGDSSTHVHFLYKGTIKTGTQFDPKLN